MDNARRPEQARLSETIPSEDGIARSIFILNNTLARRAHVRCRVAILLTGYPNVQLRHPPEIVAAWDHALAVV